MKFRRAIFLSGLVSGAVSTGANADEVVDAPGNARFEASTENIIFVSANDSQYVMSSPAEVHDDGLAVARVVSRHDGRERVWSMDLGDAHMFSFPDTEIKAETLGTLTDKLAANGVRLGGRVPKGSRFFVYFDGAVHNLEHAVIRNGALFLGNGVSAEDWRVLPIFAFKGQETPRALGTGKNNPNLRRYIDAYRQGRQRFRFAPVVQVDSLEHEPLWRAVRNVIAPEIARFAALTRRKKFGDRLGDAAKVLPGIELPKDLQHIRDLSLHSLFPSSIFGDDHRGVDVTENAFGSLKVDTGMQRVWVRDLGVVLTPRNDVETVRGIEVSRDVDSRGHQSLVAVRRGIKDVVSVALGIGFSDPDQSVHGSAKGKFGRVLEQISITMEHWRTADSNRIEHFALLTVAVDGELPRYYRHDGEAHHGDTLRPVVKKNVEMLRAGGKGPFVAERRPLAEWRHAKAPTLRFPRFGGSRPSPRGRR